MPTIEPTPLRCEIRCQRGKSISRTLLPGAVLSEADGLQLAISETEYHACRRMDIHFHLKNDFGKESHNLEMECPVTLWLPFPHPAQITAFYLYNDWWTRPAFIQDFRGIPPRTQVALFRYPDSYICFVPMVGQTFKTVLAGGTDTELCLKMTAGVGGQSSLDEPLCLIAQASDPYQAIHKAFFALAAYKNIRLREDRVLPEMFHYLGWCSWDAFYREVNEAGIRQKAEELAEKQVPVRWMVMDDGWFPSKEDRILDFKPDPGKFPQGFRPMVQELQAKNGIRWFGVWHTLTGFWGGIQPDSPLEQQEQDCLCHTVGGKLLPSLRNGVSFFQDWYDALTRDGISFVKVDGQSSAGPLFENSAPGPCAARELCSAVERAASRMNGAVINCMGMAMESILARPATAISRNSDDFVPSKEGGFSEHLLQNAYNALYHNELYCCDWDMFWTSHPDAVKHALLRAVSGGPVYVSDKPGETDPSILKPLVTLDGRVLMMDQAARPTADCIFSDPLKNGVLKLQNTVSWGGGKGGGIALYNLTDREQPFSFSPSDVPGLVLDTPCWVYDFFSRHGRLLRPGEAFTGRTDVGGFGWYLLLPDNGPAALLGLMDKYISCKTVENLCQTPAGLSAFLTESGPVGWLAQTPPRQVLVNDTDLTDWVERDGCVYWLQLPERPEKTFIALRW